MVPTAVATLSADRVEPGSISIPLAAWPETYTAPPPAASSSPTDGEQPGTATPRATDAVLAADADAVATQVTSLFNKHLASSDHAALVELFVEDTPAADVNGSSADNRDSTVTAFWRDHLAVRWTLQTAVGRSGIASLLSSSANEGPHNLVGVEIDYTSSFVRPQLAPFDYDGNCVGVSYFVTLRTKFGCGRGVVRLVHVGGEWKIWTLFTTLEALTGFEEPRGVRRPLGVRHGATEGRKTWLEQRTEDAEFRNREVDVLVVGAGQAGLSVAARLKMLKVPTLVVDVHARIGDTWRTRYRHLVLHDVVWYDYMPYMNFPDWWPVYTPKDKVADWFEAYARLLELDVWTGSRIVQDGDVDQEMGASRWDAEKKRWTLTVERSTVVAGDITVKTRHVLHPKHIIQATGHSGKPYMPDIPGINTFKGDLLRHSSAFPGAGLAAMKASTTDNAVPRTKRAVIVGACNSAHDIAQDYVESGLYASVTLLQRSSTCVFSAQAIPDLLLGVLYSENSPCASVEEADVLAWSMPMAMLKAVHRQVTAEQQRRDGPLLDSLAASGFALDDGPDHCGLWIKYIQRGGGYYIDVGASALVASGRIKVFSGPGANVAAVTPTGLRLADGSEIPADEIVFATGYGNTHGAVAGVIGAEAAKRVGDAWGFDEKGEIRGLWRPGGGGKEQNREGQDGFWLHGGNFAMCRYYSRILALQIKARLEGLVE